MFCTLLFLLGNHHSSAEQCCRTVQEVQVPANEKSPKYVSTNVTIACNFE